MWVSSRLCPADPTTIITMIPLQFLGSKQCPPPWPPSRVLEVLVGSSKSPPPATPDFEFTRVGQRRPPQKPRRGRCVPGDSLGLWSPHPGMATGWGRARVPRDVNPQTHIHIRASTHLCGPFHSPWKRRQLRQRVESIFLASPRDALASGERVSYCSIHKPAKPRMPPTPGKSIYLGEGKTTQDLLGFPSGLSPAVK